MFADHLREAIALNRERAPRYAAVTAGRSWRLSRLLVAVELSTLPTARWFDWRARPHNALGVPVVLADFLPMHLAAPWDAPLGRAGVAARETRRALHSELRGLAWRVIGQARRGDFEAAAEACARSLLALREAEAASGANFAMGAHLVESVGLAAANSPGYVSASEGRAAGLCRDLLIFQALGLPLAGPFDALAQPLHALGAGVLVNDVPPIPFPAGRVHSPSR